MKTEKTVTLACGQILPYYTDIQVGPHTIGVDYSVAQPKDAPVEGNDWPVERDYPGVTVRVRLPTCESGTLVMSLRTGRNGLPCTSVMAETLDCFWGSYTELDGAHYRAREESFHTAAMSHSFSLARAAATEAIATLVELVSSRESRLAQREETIAKAFAS